MASAAEKLRALHREQLQEGRWPSLPDGREEIILAALPTIIAVVEAAERAPCEHDILPCTKGDIRKGRACGRCSALATLSQALEPGKETP